MPKILIVEDENTMAKVLSTKFTQEGFVVHVSGDGQAGLAKAIEEKPDVIILDLLMPKMRGTEMLRRLRESGDWGARVPVIILSNFNKDEKTAWGATNLKPARYLIKVEVGIDEIVANVRAVLA